MPRLKNTIIQRVACRYRCLFAYCFHQFDLMFYSAKNTIFPLSTKCHFLPPSNHNHFTYVNVQFYPPPSPLFCASIYSDWSWWFCIDFYCQLPNKNKSNFCIIIKLNANAGRKVEKNQNFFTPFFGCTCVHNLFKMRKLWHFT